MEDKSLLTLASIATFVGVDINKVIHSTIDRYKSYETKNPDHPNCTICKGEGSVPQKRLSGRVRKVPCECVKIVHIKREFYNGR